MRTGTLLLISIYVSSIAPVFGAITLGTAETFAVLAGSTVTNTGSTNIKGNLGVSPGLAVVGFPPGNMLKGTIHAGDAVAAQAQADVTTAYNALVALPCLSNMSGQDLGGLTLTPGVYCFDSSAQVTGTLVLDFQGSNSSSFVFQIGSALTTASGSTVSLANCTGHCAIAWAVGSSATLGTSSKFSGNILALASITITTDVYICGRALAQTGAVTMDTDKVYFMGTLTPAPTELSGAGKIAVPQPDSSNPAAGGDGAASFAFRANSAGGGSSFEYTNHVTGQRIYGPIDDIEVLTTDADGSPKLFQLSGTCAGSFPQCSFVVVAERDDKSEAITSFGLAVNGQLSESRSPRPVSEGQFRTK
jgi:hypothetical protein